MKVGKLNEINRRRWIKKILRTIPKGYKILDAGAGEQRYKKYCSHLKYVSQDLAQYEGRGNKKGLQTTTWKYGKLDIISDIIAIPRPDKSFDAVLCSEVLEHLPEPIKAIREFSRLLKPNGLLILTAPFCSLTHFAPFHYYTGFNHYFYETYLPKFGFEIVEIKANGNYFEYLAQEVRRIPKVSKMYTRQKLSVFHFSIIRVFLMLLAKLSKCDRGSNELLNFGYHVLARKIK